MSLILAYEQAFLNDRSPLKIVEVADQVNLLPVEAWRSVLLAGTDQGYKQQSTCLISNEQAVAESFIEHCKYWAKQIRLCYLRVPAEGGRLSQLRFDNGRYIAAMRWRPARFAEFSRGRNFRLVINQFDFYPDPAELERAAKMSLLATDAEVVIISSHNRVRSEFWKLIQKVRQGETPGTVSRITLDDAINDGLYRRICQASNQDWTIDAQEAWRAELIDKAGDFAQAQLFCNPAALEDQLIDVLT